MINMAYCRFENTSKAMQECLDAIEYGDVDFSTLNDYEARGVVDMIETARIIVEMHDAGEFDGVRV